MTLRELKEMIKEAEESLKREGITDEDERNELEIFAALPSKTREHSAFNIKEIDCSDDPILMILTV